MNTAINRFSHHYIVSNIVMLAILACLYLLYSLGFGGIFSFDDPHTLDGLLYVKDLDSALLYITTGDTGPLGRPLALASFLIDAAAYPDSAAPFLRTNTLIHLFNVFLVALILLRLRRLAPGLLPESPWFVPLAAGFWGMLPILASTSMMVVQRMTSLSALFVLLGVFIYLWGRERHDRAVPVLFSIVGVGLCTLLAAFTKENGALLPLYLVVIEFTLLQSKDMSKPRWPLYLLRGAIILPALAVIGYLLARIPGIAGAYASRPFSFDERLATQTVILWDYLRLSFLPRPLALGPFHDDYPIYNFADLSVWLALAGWVAVLAAALWLRRIYPLLAFAVFWYLGGHLVESTVISLQLYFEHRNYLPILGPVIALAVLATRLPVAWRARAGLIGIYLAFLVFVLWQTLSIWGNRELELWAREHPGSARAIQTMAQTYAEAGRTEEALHWLDNGLRHNPALSSVAMQALRLRCQQDDADIFQAQLNWMQQNLDSSHYSSLTLHALDAIRQLHERGDCPHLALSDVHILTDQLLANPMFQASASREYLHTIKAQLYIQQGQLDPTIHHLEQAFAARPNLDTLIWLFVVLRDSGQTEAAKELLDRAISRTPERNQRITAQWSTTINALRQQLEPPL